MKRRLGRSTLSSWCSQVTNSSVYNFSNISLIPEVSKLLSYGPKFVFAAFPSNLLESLPKSLSRRFDTPTRLRNGTTALSQAVQYAAIYNGFPPTSKPYYFIKPKKNKRVDLTRNLTYEEEANPERVRAHSAVKKVLPFTESLTKASESLSKRLFSTSKSKFKPKHNVKPKTLIQLVALLKTPDVTVVLLDKNLGCAPVPTESLFGALSEFFGTSSWERFSPQEGQFKLSEAVKRMLYLLENSKPADRRQLRQFDALFRAVTPDLKTQVKPNRIKPLFKAHKPRRPNEPISQKKLWRNISMAQNAFGQMFDAVINALLGVLLDDLPFYLKDSAHAIYLLERVKLNPNATYSMGKLDFSDLYNSIDQSLMIKAVRHYLLILFEKLETERVNPGPWSVDFICTLLTLINENNFVEFNGMWYRQKIGIAMGRAFGVAGAVLTLAYVEEKMPPSLRDSFIFIKRYIDDIPFIVEGNATPVVNRLKAFFKKEAGLTLNLESLEISHGSWDSKTCDVLDFTIRRNGDHLDILPYDKPTNKHLFIPPISNHPKHTTAWIRAFLQRLARNSSSREIFLEKEVDFFRHLRARGFPYRFLTDFFHSFNYEETRALIWNKYETRQKTFSQRVQDRQSVESHSFYWVVPHDFQTRSVNWSRLASLLADAPLSGIKGVLPNAAFHTAWSNLPSLAALIDVSTQEHLQGRVNPNPNT